MTNRKEQINYRPILYIIAVYAITWLILGVMAIVQYSFPLWLSILLNFIRSNSPLIVSLFLLRKYCKRGFLRRFFFGDNPKLSRYIIVFLLFAIQFLNFYLYRTGEAVIGFSTFVTALAGQILLGGGLEEAGWRGYLQPALERKVPMALSVLLVGIIWSCWHLPYFFLPGNLHTDGSFLMYTVIAVITAFLLTAIYKLTGSVLLCTLFHGWQNTIVLTIPADMSQIGFLVIFFLLGIAAFIICLLDERART